MPKYEGKDRYLYDGTAVLKNKLGITDNSHYYLGEINAIHPFRDGNGRAQREFINHLAYKNGYCINWKNISRTEMLEASIEAFHSEEPTKLSTLIIKALQTVKI
jgi:fido (protein-threonine AMPylation protein)